MSLLDKKKNMNALSAFKDIRDKAHIHWQQLSVLYHKPYCTFIKYNFVLHKELKYQNQHHQIS